MVSNKLKVLFVAAQPRNLPPLRISAQVKRIEEGMLLAKQDGAIEFKVDLAVKFRDLTYLIRNFRPDIIHFTGHTASNRMYLTEDESGNYMPVSPEDLIALLSAKALSRTVRCVVLNSCYGAETAQELSKSIDFVIGTEDEILDTSAQAFAEALYPLLATESLADSFEVAQAQFMGHMSHDKGAPTKIPKLYFRDGKDPSQWPHPPKPITLHFKDDNRKEPPLPTVFLNRCGLDKGAAEKLKKTLLSTKRVDVIDAEDIPPGAQINKVLPMLLAKACLVVHILSVDAFVEDLWAQVTREGRAQKKTEFLVLYRPCFLPPEFDGRRFVPENALNTYPTQEHDQLWLEVAQAILRSLTSAP